MIRLLIADDERMEREALADIVMRRFEHEVTVEMAENGRKAADTAVLWEADLILMDIEMPGMNGLDAARAVLEQRPECSVHRLCRCKASHGEGSQGNPAVLPVHVHCTAAADLHPRHQPCYPQAAGRLCKSHCKPAGPCVHPLSAA